ncbi:MAG: ankyrin repeat domain-containing protein [Bryobacteraceae bacterium]|nr:ankyrin repeat domain-containing protein [Bryobacteraceae bacterium]
MRMMLGFVMAMGAAGLHAQLHDVARQCEEARIRELLSREPELNVVDANGMTPLHVAIDARQRACVSLLLQAGADRTVRDRKGRTPFEAAQAIPVVKDRADIMQLFWNAGAENRMGAASAGPGVASLEHWATRKRPEIIKLLLEMGADPNKVGSQGFQPIHDAVLADDAGVIRELVKRGTNVNAATKEDGLTPLHIAAAMGRMKALDALVSLGADGKIKDAKGRTAAEAAERAGMAEAAAMLRRTVSGC